jgi:hypothetical protein
MNPFKKALIYSKMSVKTVAKQPGLKTVLDCIRFFPSWWKHNNPVRNSVDDQMPWLTFGSIEFIKSRLRPDMVVFEYGSGGSTLFWSSRVKQVVSIEHDRDWYNRLNAEIKKRSLSNIQYRLVEPAPRTHGNPDGYADPINYASEDKQFKGLSFEAYAKSIDGFPNDYFDIIVIDGRARTSCIMHAIPKLKKSGWLIVDNTDRSYYLSSYNFKNGWEQHDFAGPVPYILHFSQTTVLKKIDNLQASPK